MRKHACAENTTTWASALALTCVLRPAPAPAPTHLCICPHSCVLMQQDRRAQAHGRKNSLPDL